MLRRLIAAFLILAALPAHAGTPLLLGTGTFSAPAAGYTGPGDIVASAKGFWGLRAYSGTYASGLGLAINICTALDALCTDIHVTATGDLSAADITTSTCTTTCTIKTMYDQSGNSHDMTMATIATRPVFKPSCIGSLPCATASGSQYLENDSFTAVNSPLSMEAGAYTNTNPGGNNRILAQSTSGTNALLFGVGPVASMFAGTVLASASLSTATFYRIIGHTDGTAGGGAISVNNTVVTGNAGSGTGGTKIAIMSIPGGSSQVAGRFVEVAIWSSNISSGNATSLDSNMSAYWGF